MTTRIGSTPRTGPDLREGQRVRLTSAGQNLNGVEGTVVRLTEHTVYIEFTDPAGRHWPASPFRHWQVSPVADAPAPYEKPRVETCPTCGQVLKHALCPEVA